MRTPYDTVVGNLNVLPKAPSQMTLGELAQFDNVLINATRGRKDLGLPENKGSSAVGAYQIIGPTRQAAGKAVFGEAWADTPFTPENQEKLAKYIWDDARARGQDISNIWVSLKGKGDFSNKSWEEVRPLILNGESGVPLPKNNNTATAAAASTLPQGLAAHQASVQTPSAPNVSTAIPNTANIEDNPEFQAGLAAGMLKAKEKLLPSLERSINDIARLKENYKNDFETFKNTYDNDINRYTKTIEQNNAQYLNHLAQYQEEFAPKISGLDLTKLSESTSLPIGLASNLARTPIRYSKASSSKLNFNV